LKNLEFHDGLQEFQNSEICLTLTVFG